MRLICPSCAAEYEVADALIPAAGRDVECAACGHGWYQLPRMVLGEAQAAPAPAAPPPMPRTTPAALAILREEAQRELSARAAERGPDPAATRVAAATLREGAAAAPDLAPLPVPLPATAPALPDPAAMAASLRWDDPQPPASASAPTPAAPARDRVVRRRNRYDQGFKVALLLALALLGAYAAAPSLAGRAGVGAALTAYRAEVDRGRLWLYDRTAPRTDRAVARVRAFLDR